MTDSNFIELPVDAIAFDCDGTLSQIEGIDELAEQKNVGDQVKALTEQAMNQTGLNPTLYKERLALVQPSEQEVLELGKKYLAEVVLHVKEVIQIFLRLKKNIYLISAGLYPSVKYFGLALGIPEDHIYAVDIKFDAYKNYLDFDHQSPLIHNNGKREIITQLKKINERILYVGDGINDYAVYDLVTRFVGFGGVFYRSNVQKFCDYYIYTKSMSPLLSLALTSTEMKDLTPAEKILCESGKKLL